MQKNAIYAYTQKESHMRDFEVWKSYIDALDILTNQYSEPFDIKVLEAKNDSSIVCRYIDSNQKDKIFEGLLKVYPRLKKENVNYQDNHLLYPSSEAINNSEIEDLKSFADSNHFEFSSKPAFSGTFKYNRAPLIDFLKEHIIKEKAQERKTTTRQNLGKTQFLTLDELKHIDSELETNLEVYREDTLGAISKIDASESFINKQFDIALRYLQEHIGLAPYKVEGFFKQIHLKDVSLKKEIFEAFQENTFYSHSFHLVSYTITPDEFDKFEQIRKQRKIYYRSEDRPNLEGVILPNPDNNVFIQTFSASISLSDLQFEIFFFISILKRYFGKEHIQIVHEHIFRIDKQRFFEHIKEVIPYEEFQISSDAETISFDFKTKEELNEKLQKLDAYDSLNYLGFRDDHKYKVTFGNITPLFQVKEKLVNCL